MYLPSREYWQKVTFIFKRMFFYWIPWLVLCKMKNDVITTRFPIHKSLLNLLLKEMEKYYTSAHQSYLEKLFKAMFVSVYYGLLRAGEIATGPHVILAENVSIGTNKDKILFLLRTSKTHDISCKPQLVKITRASGTAQARFCPFKILNDYIECRPPARNAREQFFVFSDNSPVKPDHVRNLLKILLTRNQFNPQLYSLHSFRIGRCSDLLKLGLSVKTIKHLGRWKSNAVFRYLRNWTTTFLISDNVKAYYDLWMIGGKFLEETATSLKALQMAIRKNISKTPLYMVQMFNIYCFTPHWSTEGLAKLKNPLVDALNERKRLPKYLLVIPDKDYIDNILTPKKK